MKKNFIIRLAILLIGLIFLILSLSAERSALHYAYTCYTRHYCLYLLYGLNNELLSGKMVVQAKPCFHRSLREFEGFL